MAFDNAAKKYLIVMLGIVLMLAATTFSIFSHSRKEARMEAADLTAVAREDGAPLFTREDGEVIAIEDLRDRVVVVSVWASWCTRCAVQLEALNKIAETYDEEISVYAVNREENPNIAKKYLETIPELTALTFVYDGDDHFFAATSGYAMPETVVYDAEGNIVFRVRDVISYEDLKNKIETVIN